MYLFRTKDQIFEPPSRLERLITAPLKYTISLVYRCSNRLRSAPTPKNPIRVVCISDTHTHKYDDIPEGDILVHAGDACNDGTISEMQQALDWLNSLPHKYKIMIAGNHDSFLDPRSRATLNEADQTGDLDWKGIHYLQHNSISLAVGSEQHGVRKISIYGAPQIPVCGGSNFAFQYARGQDAWSDTIPKDTDILVTHTPPKYHRDLINPSLGCEHLLAEVWRVRPRLHIFGHVHAGAGKEIVWWDEAQRAYEAGLAGSAKGLLREALDVRSWIALAKVLVYGTTGFLWNRIWGGEGRHTVMVNAALMKSNTGRLGNPVQVVCI